MTWVTGSQSATFEGTWEFDDKKENIITKMTFGNITAQDTSKILRLKSNELWVEEKDGNDINKYYYITKK